MLCQGSKQLPAEVKPKSSDVYLNTGKTRADFQEKQLESMIFIDS